MVDIRLLEHEKRIIKLGTNLIRKKLGKNASVINIHKYLHSTRCEALKELLNIINFIAMETKSFHQAKYIREYAEFGLYICINHPDLRMALEGMLKTFTKYDNVKIDLETNFKKFDKFILEAAIRFIFKKLNSRPTYILILNEYLTVSNPILKFFVFNIDKALKNIKNDFIHDSIKSLAWVGLYIMIMDTAYRSQIYYGIHKFGNDYLKEQSESFFYEPDKWYININDEGRKKTREKWKNKELPKHDVDILEKPCVPFYQKKRMNNILKRIGGAFFDA